MQKIQVSGDFSLSAVITKYNVHRQVKLPKRPVIFPVMQKNSCSQQKQLQLPVLIRLMGSDRICSLRTCFKDLHSQLEHSEASETQVFTCL